MSTNQPSATEPNTEVTTKTPTTTESMTKETSTQLVVFSEILYLDIRLLQIGSNCFIAKEKHIYEVLNLPICSRYVCTLLLTICVFDAE